MSAVVPDSAPQGITLDITVSGSGYEPSSSVCLERGGQPVSTIVTNRVTYVTSRKLIANITIAAAAETGSYDVAVLNTGGRKGVGIELFAVTLQVEYLPDFGGRSGEAWAVNDAGVILGSATDRSGVRSGVKYPVRWTMVNGTWTVTKLSATATSDAVARAINNVGIIGGQMGERAKIWLPSGQVFDLGPGCITGINSAGTTIGMLLEAGVLRGVVWTRSAQGWNPPQQLPDGEMMEGRLSSPTCVYHGQWISAWAINDAGVIAGLTTINGERAVTWTPQGPDGPWSAPVQLPGVTTWPGNSGAYAINNAGDVAGVARPPNPWGRGFGPILWHHDGRVIDLRVRDEEYGWAFGMNDAPTPQLVGRFQTPGTGSSKPDGWIGGFVWTSEAPSPSPLPKGGTVNGDGSRDINNGSPRLIVGTINDRPLVWKLP